ncbi:hypothetical protein TherJR_2751 [Thermincola potens JR]|uniref:Uncharacterized protein n=2 Tax=Thermincola TaxID=278993 RepID=D5XCD2_THEPJ|nr:hypothetical protein TherJR_2751 [Thermincola potens JR]
MRKIAVLSLVVLLLGFSGICYAATIGWSPSISWGDQTKKFSPDSGNTSFYGRKDSTGNLYVDPKSRWQFTQTNINDNYNLFNLYNQYYGFDIAVQDDNNTTVSAVNDGLYCNLPNPKIDLEDDGGLFGTGNGYYDEIEATCTTPLLLQANTDYRLNGSFRVYKTSTIQFGFTSQTSKKSSTGEYNTMDWQTHVYRNYPW